MSNYTRFEIGQTFPLAIHEQGDGGLFQVDANGTMFILQLAHTDVIAHEAFRTGAMEFALYKENGILFLLYKIDGIFKEGWGDAPLSLHTIPAEHQPTGKSLDEGVLHLYLVDSNLRILLAQRDVPMNEGFQYVLRDYVENGADDEPAGDAFKKTVQKVWSRISSADMRKRAEAVMAVELDIPKAPSQMKH